MPWKQNTPPGYLDFPLGVCFPKREENAWIPRGGVCFPERKKNSPPRRDLCVSTALIDQCRAAQSSTTSGYAAPFVCLLTLPPDLFSLNDCALISPISMMMSVDGVCVCICFAPPPPGRLPPPLILVKKYRSPHLGSYRGMMSENRRSPPGGEQRNVLLYIPEKKTAVTPVDWGSYCRLAPFFTERCYFAHDLPDSAMHGLDYR